MKHKFTLPKLTLVRSVVGNKAAVNLMGYVDQAVVQTRALLLAAAVGKTIRAIAAAAQVLVAK